MKVLRLAGSFILGLLFLLVVANQFLRVSISPDIPDKGIVMDWLSDQFKEKMSVQEANRHFENSLSAIQKR